jgi:hypothetical protein
MVQNVKQFVQIDMKQELVNLKYANPIKICASMKILNLIDFIRWRIHPTDNAVNTVLNLVLLKKIGRQRPGKQPFSENCFGVSGNYMLSNRDG